VSSWKKSFRNIPRTVEANLATITSQNIQVLAGKKVTAESIRAGTYGHSDLDEASFLKVGAHWDVIPPAEVGLISARNREGWDVIRKDLPKYNKYFYQDIPIYGDGARNGWTTAAIPPEVYHRDLIPPYLLQLNVLVQEYIDPDAYGLVFSVDQVFDRATPSFNDDILFALNLLQENTGVSGVASAENPEFVFTTPLNWSVFPPGDVETIATAWIGDREVGCDPRHSSRTVKAIRAIQAS
jgi:hypothetical protein